MPSPEDARKIGKRAADKLPNKKEKERWKEKAKAARQVAKKAGADDEAIAAAGQAARAKAETAYIQTEQKISGLGAAAPPLASQPEPDAEQEPELHVCSDACGGEDVCPQGRALIEATMSNEGAALIIAAFNLFYLSKTSLDPNIDEELQLGEVRYTHALRRFKGAHPQFCGWGQRSEKMVIEWTIRLAAAGHPVPAAEAVARKIGFPMHKCVEDEKAHTGDV